MAYRRRWVNHKFEVAIVTNMLGQAAHIEGKVHARQPQESALRPNVLRLGVGQVQKSSSHHVI